MSIPRLPTIFLGHGSPMNTLETNRHTEAWSRFGKTTPAPKAILSVSAHWYTRGSAVTAVDKPATIHDFYGFPKPLFDYQYPAPGSPALAGRVRDLLAPVDVAMDEEWGLDHGTWSVLAHVYPGADIPVVQLSIDGTKPPSFHYDLGKRLAPLRDEGVLIMASGNVVHNLGVMRRGGGEAYDWGVRFNNYIHQALAGGNDDALVRYDTQGRDAQLSVPTPEHYLPLLYVLGAGAGDKAKIETDGMDMGSISMLSVSFGALA